PVADAGPDRLDVAAGVIHLDGSGSYDPDGDAITYQWNQVSGPVVSITGASTAQPTFTAAASQTYVFRLVVTDDKGAFGQARVTIGTAAARQLKIIRFTAQPPQIDAGGTSTLVWEVRDADEVTISGIGQVNAKAGTSTVTLSQTTTYTLTAKNSVEEASETITVTVSRPQVRIVSFLATPASIASGGSTTLSWETENATEAAIGGIGSVSINGATSVSPTATTTYTLTAKNQFGEVSTTATATVTVVVVPPSNRPPVADAGPNQTSMRFPMQLNGSASYDPDGDPITYLWRVSGAKPASIVGANTATPSVTPQQGYGDYIFELTVTDDKGARSAATTTVNYIDP
ncbi:MAG: OmpA/MotB domain protein, partial [candidate division NC10 bacterium]|nr:OmpA/MotB domain protein [candidate division NC10 bacterium]